MIVGVIDYDIVERTKKKMLRTGLERAAGSKVEAWFEIKMFFVQTTIH